MLWIAICLLAGLPSTAPAPPTSAPSHRRIVVLDTKDLPESSGVVASRVTPDVYWTHNDSGDGPFVYAFRLSRADRERQIAHLLGTVELIGATNVDWEDIA